MLFASTELAARIERAECELVTHGVAAIERVRTDAEVMLRSIGGGMAAYSGPDSPLNKVAGLGFAGPVDEKEFEELERAYADRHAPVQVELSCLADPSVGQMLTGRGYRLMGFENVLGRALPADAALSAPSDVTVTTSDETDFATWLDVVVTGFAHPDDKGVPSHESFPREVLEQVVGDMARAEGFVRYLATRNGEPAGGGSMHTAAGVAQLSGAATLPAHRRQGVQAALLAHRLSEAARSGCEVAVVTTQPGSTSQKNVQRKGFDLLYTRAVLVLAPTGS